MTRYAYGIGQSMDGILWFGGKLFGFDGAREVQFTGPGELTRDFIDAVYTTPQGDLWLGSRTYGVFRHDGTAWQRFGYKDGLADNRVGSVFRDRDGAIWVGTAEGVSRFDGRTWFPNALPSKLPRTEFYDPILQGTLAKFCVGCRCLAQTVRTAARRSFLYVAYYPICARDRPSGYPNDYCSGKSLCG